MRSILLAGGLALFGTLFGTRFAIGLLVKRGYGQFIRDDGPTSHHTCLLYTSPSPRDGLLSRMPSSA